MKIESPTVNLPSVRRTGLPPGHAAVFDLEAGRSFASDQRLGRALYLQTEQQETRFTLDQATNEIHSKLQNDRTREMMDKVNSSFKVETNDAYFGPGGVGPRAPRVRGMDRH